MGTEVKQFWVCSTRLEAGIWQVRPSPIIFHPNLTICLQRSFHTSNEVLQRQSAAVFIKMQDLILK
jgi:hypothetical protein